MPNAEKLVNAFWPVSIIPMSPKSYAANPEVAARHAFLESMKQQAIDTLTNMPGILSNGKTILNFLVVSLTFGSAKSPASFVKKFSFVLFVLVV